MSSLILLWMVGSIDNVCMHIKMHYYLHDIYMPGIRGPLTDRNHREKFTMEATRATFITRQDCRNITRRLQQALDHHHSNDALSVDRQEGSTSPVIAYKPQGKEDNIYPLLHKENFLLVIMTEFQANMFKKHSGKIVCVDSTHKTNPYGFKLVTIVVPDEFKNGR